MRHFLMVILLCLPFAALEQTRRNAFKMKHLLYASVYMSIATGLPYLYAYPSHLCADHGIVVGIFCVLIAISTLIALTKMVVMKAIRL